MAKIDGPKGALLIGAIAASFNGCGGNSGEKAPETNTSNPGSSTPDSNITIPGNTNHAPKTKDNSITISIPEFSKSVTNLLENVTDLDGDKLRVVNVTMADGNTTLPVGYSFNEQNLTIDASGIDVPDATNLKYDLNVTVTDGLKDVSYTVNSLIQDGANDRYVVSVNNIRDIPYNGTLNGEVTLRDPDGLLQPNIDFDLIDSNGNTVYSGVMQDLNGDATYTFTIDTQAESINSGRYTIKTEQIETVNGGENPEGQTSFIKSFNVLDEVPAVETPTLTFDVVDDIEKIEEKLVNGVLTFVFKIETIGDGEEDNTGKVKVNLSNGGILVVNGIEYRNGDYFNINDAYYNDDPNNPSSGTMKLLKSDGTIVWEKPFIGD